MKKIFTVAAIVMSVAAQAQHKSKDLRIGFKVEPNVAWLHPVENGVKNDGSRVGINYGLMIDYQFADNYFISTGLQVTHVGGKLSYTGNGWSDKKVGYITADNSSITNTANYTLRMQYLEFPFAIKLKTNNRGRMDFWGCFGGFLAFPLKARADVQTNFAVNGVANYAVDNDNAMSNVQPITVGMQIGGGVEIPFSDNKTALVAGLVFNNGFVDVTKNGSWGGDGRINLNNIALRLGVYF